jgi:hypothetical protein
MQKEHAQEVKQADLYVVEVKDDQTDEGGCESEVGVASCEEDIELGADDSLGKVESDAEVNESESSESGGEYPSEQDQDDEAEGIQSEGEAENGLDCEDNDLICEGYTPRVPIQKPGVKEKVYALYRHKGIFGIYPGVVQEKTIGKGGTPSHFERVLFDDDQESYDVQRDNIDTRKHYALLRCFISNVVRRPPSESDFQTLESELRACFDKFDGKQLQRLTVFVGNNTKSQQLAEQLVELCGRLGQKTRPTLNEYQIAREELISTNKAMLVALGLKSQDGDDLKKQIVEPRKPRKAKQEGGERRVSQRLSSQVEAKLPRQELQTEPSSSSSSSSTSCSSCSSTEASSNE